MSATGAGAAPVSMPGSVPLPAAALCVLVVFLSALIGALAPLALAVGPSPPRVRTGWFRVGNAFAAGFLSSAALVHLLPDADHALAELYPTITYPIAPVLAVAGACAVLCLDILLRHRRVVQDAAPDSSGMICYPHDMHSPGRAMPPAPSLHEPAAKQHAPGRAVGDDTPLLASRGTEDRGFDGTDGLIDAVALCSPCLVNHHQPAVDAASGQSAPTSLSNAVMPYILCVALSFHSLVEGLALGVSASARPQFVALFLAILAHKFFAAFALGVSLVSSLLPSAPRAEWYRMIWAAVGFAGTTPAGALVGITVSRVLVPRVARVAAAVMSSFSAGIFLFVAFGQLVADEFRCSCLETSDAKIPASSSTEEVSSNALSEKDAAIICAGVFALSAAAMSVLAIWV
jgi:zinc transporter ZupT